MAAVPVPVSQFPDGNLPLIGSELVPIVQDGVTRKVPSGAFSVFSTALVPEVFKAVPAGTSHNVSADGALRLFLDTTAGAAIITGFTPDGGTPWRDGQILIVTNAGAAALLELAVETGSLPENQMYGVTNITLPPHGSMMLVYSATLQKLVMS